MNADTMFAVSLVSFRKFSVCSAAACTVPVTTLWIDSSALDCSICSCTSEITPRFHRVVTSAKMQPYLTVRLFFFQLVRFTNYRNSPITDSHQSDMYIHYQAMMSDIPDFWFLLHRNRDLPNAGFMISRHRNTQSAVFKHRSVWTINIYATVSDVA